MDVASLEAYLSIAGQFHRIEIATVSGILCWERSTEQTAYYAMRQVPNGEVFAGAAIALGNREGEMYALVISPDTREAGVHIMQLSERHKNMIRKLRVRSTGELDP
jgi:N-acetylglutamate synthase-like GNAT family acetyltransferase